MELLAIRLDYQKTIAKSLVIPQAGEGDKDSLREFYVKACMAVFPDFEQKICMRADFVTRTSALQRPLVFTNGCFDVLHRGHVTYLAQARALGAALVVGVNSDASVKRLEKGDDRPVNSQEDRMAVLAALQAVDLVVLFDEDTPLELILACRPDVLVKGGDWTPDAIVGAREVQSWGGTVHSIPFLHQRSTTALINKIRTH